MISLSVRAAAVTAILAFLAVPADATPCPRDARHCRAQHRISARDWDLHRPSTPAERAETRALNNDALAARTTPAWAPRPDGRGDYRRAQIQYQRELREYYAAQQRYAFDMRRYGEGPRPREGWDMRDHRPMSALPPPPHRPETAQELDNDPFAPTGGVTDPRIAAPTPGLDGATTGLTQFNARSSGLVPPRYDDGYGPPGY